MLFSIEKDKLHEESSALKQLGYTINLTKMNSPVAGQSPLRIDVIPPNQENGVTFIIYPNKNCANTMTFLNKKNLTDFLDHFPRDIAPSFSELLDNNPPEPSGKIKNNYSFNIN